MNPLTLIIQLFGPLLVSYIQQFGQVALTDLETELNKLLGQFGASAKVTPSTDAQATPTPTPTPPSQN